MQRLHHGIRRSLVIALTGLLAITLAEVVTSGRTPATAATTVTVGADLAAGPGPDVACAQQTCTAVQTEGPGATLVPVSGQVTRLRIRHGRLDGGGLLSSTARLLVLHRDGDTFTLVRHSGELPLAATESEDSVSTLSVSLTVSAGDYLGLQLSGGYADSRPAFLATSDAAETSLVLPATHSGGSASYASTPGTRALFAAEISPGGTGGPGSGGPGVGGPGVGGSGVGGSGGNAALACPSPTAARPAVPGFARTDAADRPARAGKRWSRRVIGRQDRMMDLQLAYDRAGRAHLAARGATRYQVHYYGPGGHRSLDSTVDQNDGVGLALGADGRPTVLWGERKPTTLNGRLRYCPRLHLAVPGGQHRVLRALPESTRSAFLHPEVVRAGGSLHLAYDVNGRLVHHRLGKPARTLPVTEVRRVRMAARGSRVLIGATSSAGRLTVFERSAKGRVSILLRARRVHDFDLAFARRKPVVAWSGGTVRRLTVLTGGKRIRTRTPAEAVGVATRGAIAHVAFSTVARTTCGAFGCLRSGVYHVALRGRRIVQAPSVVQRSGESPFRLAVATTGRTVGVAMSRNGVTALHQRRT